MAGERRSASRSRMGMLGVVLVTFALATPTPSQAQDDGAPSEVDEAARLLFQRGVESYRGGRFDEALQRFEQAYDLTGDPELLFNIGTTLDRLRRDREAVDAFERYLAARPEAPNRPAVERRLEALRASLPPLDEAEDDPEVTVIDVPDAEPEEDPAPPDEGGGLHPAIFWTGVGATAVLGGVLIWSGLDTLDKNDAYEGASNQAEARPLLDDAQAAQDRTNVLIGVTAVVGAATVVLALFTDFGEDAPDDGDDDGAGVTLVPAAAAGPDGGFVGLSGRF